MEIIWPRRSMAWPHNCPRSRTQGTSIIKNNNFTFCLGKSRENVVNIFQDFPELKNKIQGLSRTAKKIQDFSRMWQPCLLFLHAQ